MGSPYIVGALYPPDDVIPPFSQPGGPGTAVFPQQSIGEKLGMFVAGCGHWFNNWMVRRSSETEDSLPVSVALIQCPLCGFLQNKYSPFEVIYTDPFFIIIG